MLIQIFWATLLLIDVGKTVSCMISLTLFPTLAESPSKNTTLPVNPVTQIP